jgi:hypothetical protein
MDKCKYHEHLDWIDGECSNIEISLTNLMMIYDTASGVNNSIHVIRELVDKLRGHYDE